MPSRFRRTGPVRVTCPAVIAGALAAFGLAGCVEAPRPSQPTFYNDLGSASARVDAGEARAMISAYRMNAGLKTLTLDPALVEAAQREASAMPQPTSRVRPMRSRRGWQGRGRAGRRSISPPATVAWRKHSPAGATRRSTTG